MEKMVTADPGPEYLPSGDAGTETGPGQQEESPVVGGLEAKADDPATAEPLEDPQELVGERPATGSNASPG